jgi:uncharacterized RDD family membrane protein YckC
MNFLPVRLFEKPVYAGFWKRLWATAVDLLAFVAALYILTHSYNPDKPLAIVVTALNSILFAVYSVYFNKKFGGTLGKLAAGIRITKPDGTAIGWPEVWKRSSVDIVLAFLYLVANVSSAKHIVSTGNFGLTTATYLKLLNSHRPSWFAAVETLQEIWFWSELVVLLFNKRKRALHDFIAGTVVIRKEFARPAVLWEKRDSLPAGQ